MPSDFLVEPWPLRGTQRDEPTPPITKAISDAADRLLAERVVKGIVRENGMSLLGKMKALTESAEDFTKGTETVLDGIAEKIKIATAKRDIAAEKHHGFYDGIIKGVDDSVTVIDRLSNGNLTEDGNG